MKNKIFMAYVGAAIFFLGAILILSSLFQVKETEQVLIIQFGNPLRMIQKPGLYIKAPFIQDKIVFDKRILSLDPPARQILLVDQKRIDVDSYARYRIIDPLAFYKTAATLTGFNAQFGSILDSIIRKVLGREGMVDILSPKRQNIMNEILRQAEVLSEKYGVRIIDVRIGRTDLPENISKNVYERMRVEREREANLLRAEGDEEKQKTMSLADKNRIKILAEATEQARKTLGEGMAQRNLLISKVASTNPGLFTFFRSMEAYENSLKENNTTFVLSPKSGFLRYMDK